MADAQEGPTGAIPFREAYLTSSDFSVRVHKFPGDCLKVI